MRRFYYLAGLAVFALAMFFNARHLERKHKAEIVSISSEWAKHGKPVDVIALKRTHMDSLVAISGVPDGINTLSVMVPPDIRSKLKTGDLVSSAVNGEYTGRVTYVAQDKDIYTGMYRLGIKVNEGRKLKPGSITDVYIRTDRLNGIIKVPLSAVFKGADGDYCWVVRDGRVRKRKLFLGISNADEVLVEKGVADGEMVVVKGMQVLNEGDAVRIRSEGRAE